MKPFTTVINVGMICARIVVKIKIMLIAVVDMDWLRWIKIHTPLEVLRVISVKVISSWLMDFIIALHANMTCAKNVLTNNETARLTPINGLQLVAIEIDGYK